MWVHELPPDIMNQLWDKTDRKLRKHDIVEWRCPIHGKYTQELRQKTDYGRGCNRCARSKIVKNLHTSGRMSHKNTDFEKRKQRYKENTAKNRIYPNWFIDSLAYEEDKERARKGMISTNSKAWFKCPKCGKVHEKYVTNVIRSSTMEQKYARDNNEVWCRHCSQVSREGITEKNVLKWIKENIDNEADKEKNFFKDVETRATYEGDIVLHSCKKVIEIDGAYWHTEEKPEVIAARKVAHDNHGQPIGYHRRKDAAIESKGYIVLHICTEDYDKDPEKYKEIIADWIENGTESVPSKFMK